MLSTQISPNVFEVKEILTANAVIAAAIVKMDLARNLLRKELRLKKKLIRMHKTQKTNRMEGRRSSMPRDKVANKMLKFSATSANNSFLLRFEELDCVTSS